MNESDSPNDEVTEHSAFCPVEDGEPESACDCQVPRKGEDGLYEWEWHIFTPQLGEESQPWYARSYWCGRRGQPGGGFQNLDHAAQNGLNGSRFSPCGACVDAATKALRVGGERSESIASENEKSCLLCEGSGSVWSVPCGDCGGTGRTKLNG